tara:strand:- start:963 stop:1208 length:246 start_codon:yes stop_codon:yes gene_type:complete
MKAIPLKDKILTYEQDYIETEIRWNLKLGDEIFKKSDVKRAVFWLKSEILKISSEKNEISLNKALSLINNSFSDVTTNKKK